MAGKSGCNLGPCSTDGLCCVSRLGNFKKNKDISLGESGFCKAAFLGISRRKEKQLQLHFVGL